MHRRAAVDLTAPPGALRSACGGCLRGINHGLATDCLGRPDYGQLLARTNDANAPRSFIGGKGRHVLVWGFQLRHNRSLVQSLPWQIDVRWQGLMHFHAISCLETLWQSYITIVRSQMDGVGTGLAPAMRVKALSESSIASRPRCFMRATPSSWFHRLFENLSGPLICHQVSGPFFLSHLSDALTLLIGLGATSAVPISCQPSNSADSTNINQLIRQAWQAGAVLPAAGSTL